MSNSTTTTDGPPRTGQSRLGRGLNALFDSKTTGRAAISAAAGAPREGAGLKHIDIDRIQSNPFQPRCDFDEAALQELVTSLKTHGVLQPLLVRPHGDGYQLVAGERRLRAARAAGLAKVPCFVRSMEDREVNEAALEENIKREDLNVLEKAEAFRRYLDTFGGTINDLARRLSMTRSNVNNILRLLELSEPVKDALRNDRISYGHARCLLALDATGQKRALAAIERDDLSVRATEALVRRL
ncbi:MAG: ParB/RepB/Spo0J family partition protein, partial [Planctomycetota bacterium]